MGLIKGVEMTKNRCLTSLNEELTSWDICDVWYRAGKRNAGQDALSRKPAALKQDVLDSLDLAHQSVTAMILQAQISFFGARSRQTSKERETCASAVWR